MTGLRGAFGALFYVQDVRYVAVQWMARSDDVGDDRSFFAPAKTTFPPSMVVVCRGAMRPTGMWEGRVTQDDSMDGIGRVESGTEIEQLPRWQEATMSG